MNSIRRSGVTLMPLLVAMAACTVNVTAPAETAPSATAATSVRAPESAALAEARKKVKDIEWQIGQAESALRQLSPPIRSTDSKGTTFDVDKQRAYENNRSRIDRQIRDLKEEKLTWEFRVNQLLAANANVSTEAAPLAPIAAPIRAPESTALLDARKKVRDIDWQIGQAESALRQLSPPVRVTDSKGTTFDVDKQRTYENNRARIDRQIRDLKEEKLIWELRVNQLVLAQTR